jgi:type IX secretion system PorP/SprF family membrane protein
MMKKILQFSVLLFVVNLLATLTVQAQDPLFSQFYASPLSLNPAFAGTTNVPRVVNNFRNQFTNSQGRFITYSLTADYFIENFNSGVGITLQTDKQGVGGYRSTDAGLTYAYQLQIKKNKFFRMGIYGNYFRRDLNYSNLLFNDEINSGRPSNEVLPNLQTGFFDLGLGGMYYERNFWIGVSARHLNQPDQSLLQDGTDRLPIRTTVHAGYKIFLQDNCFDDESNAIGILANYNTQFTFRRFEFGTYVFFNRWLSGVFYQGSNSGTSKERGDAFSVMAGYKLKGITLTYSYDFAFNNPNRFPRLGNSHEIAIAYLVPFKADKNNVYRKMKSKRYTPWPTF